MKKLLALLIALITVFSISACGGKDGEPSEADPDTKIENELKEEEKEAEKDGKEEDKAEDKKEEKKEDKKEDSTAKNPATGKPATSRPAEEKPIQNEIKPEQKPEEKPAETTPPASETVPEEKPQEAPKTAGNILLADFKARAASSSSALEIAEALVTNSIIPFSGGAMSVEPGYLSGFGNAEITGFKEGATFGPVIGSIPFIGYVFILEDGTDASSFISTLKSNADLRWNICVEAEEAVAGSVGNKVFFVMTNKNLSE